VAPRKRILFGSKPEWEAGLRKSTDPAEFEIVMAELGHVDFADCDAVVPLDLRDHNWLDAFGGSVPALTVPGSVRRMCHDKLVLNNRLIDLGFGDAIPRLHERLPADLSDAPILIKARIGSFGKNIHLLQSNRIPEGIEELLAAGSHFIQEYTPGSTEYATHVLIHQGAPKFWLTNEYVMGEAPCIKGVAKRALRSRWLKETPGQGVFQQMLKAIGFDRGTCCIDYRMVDGRPRLFEINPRFGGSLSWNVAAYLRSYVACVDRDQSGGAAKVEAT
jgi:hypothetical protein